MDQLKFQKMSLWLFVAVVLVTIMHCAEREETSDSDIQIKPEIFESSKVDRIRSRLKNSQSDQVLVVAHRGDWRNAPENSIQAITNCIDMGVDIVELDIKKTKDGELILMHDKSLDRTTNGHGYVSDWTLDSLRTLNLRNGTGRLTHHTIPTLEEAMTTAKGKVMINLDHCYDYFAEAFSILEKTGTSDQVIIKGYRKTVAQVNKDLGPYLHEVIFMPIIDLDQSDARNKIDDFQQMIEPYAMELVFQMDTSRVLKELEVLKERGARIWVNALWAKLNAGHEDDLAVKDREAAYGWITRTGANIIQTDRPSLLLTYLRNRELHD